MVHRKHKQHRPFQLGVSYDGETVTRFIPVVARSSLEAGSIVLENAIVPPAHSVINLIDPASAAG